MKKSYIFPCSKCGKEVEHSENRPRATCFDCKKIAMSVAWKAWKAKRSQCTYETTAKSI